MKLEAQAWKAALDSYSYPVDLRKYKFRTAHEDCFEWTAKKGGREETIAFEEHFRRLAPNVLNAWFEVVFWKLASQPQIRNGTTQRIAESLSKHATAGELWHTCDEYVQSRAEAEARTQNPIQGISQAV